MTKDKLYSVRIRDGEDLVFGLVKGEAMEDALAYLRREYPHATVEEVQESHYVLL